MINMTKYIRVIEEIEGLNKKIILRFNKCNDCPLMTFSKKDFNVSCRKFNNNDNDKIINDFVLDIDDNGPIEDISVPKWCGLPNDIYDLNVYKETYLKKDNKIMTSIGNTEKNLPIYDISYFNKIFKTKINKINDVVPFTIVSNDNFNKKQFDDENPFDLDYDRIIDNYKQSPKIREVEEEEDDEDELIFNARNIVRQLPKLREVEEEEEEDDYIQQVRVTIPPLLICSSCGGHSLSVDRYVNNGMCTDCYNTYHNDSIKMKQTFITNFRLKRGSFFVSRNFKSVE